MRPVRALGLLTVVLVAGCGTGSTPASPATSAGGAGSGIPRTTATDRPDSPTPPAPTPSRCGPTTLTVTERAAPAPACLVVGVDLRVVSDPSPLQPWSTLVSSDPAVLRCASSAQPQGVVAGICHSVRPGVVMVSTGTAPFAGDPHGPSQYLWQITITVIG